MDKIDLLHALRDGHAPIAAAAGALSDDQLLEAAPGVPGWTRKDVLAHLEFWHRHATAFLAGLRSGANPDPAGGEPFDLDAVNERAARESRGRTAADVRAGEAASFGALAAAVDGATDRELFDEGVQPWQEGTAAETVMGDACNHYPLHLPNLAAD